MDLKTKAILFGALTFLLSGVVTALIPNPIFARMVTITWLDYFFLLTTSILAGQLYYIYSKKQKNCVDCKVGVGSMFLGIFSFSCPICSKLVVALLGYSFAINVLDPLRPILGLISLFLLLFINRELIFSKLNISKSFK